MDAFLGLSERERRNLCQETGAAIGIEASSVEKDFWICWILRELFALPDLGRHLTFKGGTSLSKGWKLIERFSEDIDVVVDRESLGFGGQRSPEAATGTKERQRRLDALAVASQECVNGAVRTALDASLRTRMPKDLGWELLQDDEAEDQQSLLFRYPALYGGAGYLNPVVRLEFGARSDTDPSAAPEIQPYISEYFPGALPDGVFTVNTVAPKRTFWEKAMLLHEEALRGAKPKPRLARHYYDLWCLIRRGVAVEAAKDLDLFRRIAEHRSVFFRKNRQVVASLKPGSLQVLPAKAQIPVWRRDYDAMREAMFFGEVPDFDDVMTVVEGFQTKFNQSSAPAR